MSEDIGFQGFDDLDEFDSSPVHVELPPTIEAASKNTSVAAVADMIIETCPKCFGSGRYHHRSEHGIMCLKCNGKGTLTFKTTAAQRCAARAKAAANREKKQTANLEAFEAQHPEFAEWWRDTDFAYAISLRDDVKRCGKLSESQIAAGKKCIASFKAMQEERTKREAAEAERVKALPVLDMSAVTTAMDRASGNGIKHPKIRLLAGDVGFVLSFASEKGKWAGSLYLKDTAGEYLGRITSGKFYRSRDVSGELEAAILVSCGAPAESAVAYGRRTGSCSCCGRELTNHASIEAGIGPICASNFFG
ncbi:DUF6011 domain-containing protein [Pseudomonas aeruginosa]|uniref:DUF6011 domain-containing protein n=1 Tax=Pseudomonas aeruginosa TaxID=287 RepID=UPI002B26FC3E|nr:DUF6011 domain-containing protein [Pseudomonas aeruginosa]MEA8593038.1 DUF6011 domain-containing protein [Pseudomonas aeruginosa]